MKIRGFTFTSLSIILGVLMVLPLTSEAWFATDHMNLAQKGVDCVSLPQPPKKRCESLVDDIILRSILRIGSVVPDITDGSSSPKHAFNPEYEPNKAVWDPKIRTKLGMPNAQINAGAAIQTIAEEIGNTKGLLDTLKNNYCKAGLGDYSKVWYQFGRLSHYPADLAVPFHAYSVAIDNRYHEGDIRDAGNWFRGLWDLTKGQGTHTFLEFIMGAYTNFNLLGCTPVAPIQVSKNARDAMKKYETEHGTGYEGLIYDFFLSSIDVGFFGNNGQRQAQDAIGGICSAWSEALRDWNPPLNCGCQSSNQSATAVALASSADETSCEEPPNDCENANQPPPGGDAPDDTANVATASIPSTSDDLLEQAWDRLAAKKNKKSLIWYWMQEYLLEEFYRGNIDEETYQRLSGSYGLTADEVSELFYDNYIKSPDVAILGRGFALSLSDLLQNKFYEPIRRFTVDDFSPDALKDYPAFIIPSGGLMGLENSDIFKVKLDEYVKQGGTLIVFAQQHGYEFSALPVPQETDGTFKKISGYGWSEDQSCFYGAAYIDTWHQILAGQSKTAPNFHMDGYFTSYPSNATVLLRRTANGQPALVLYEYGQGKVILTSMYSDFALKQNQASSYEIILIRDMISWAKRPEELPEIKPGESVTVSVSITNNTNNDLASVKVWIYNPDRSALLSEETATVSIPTGQPITIPVTYTTTQGSALGIYHIDYTLYDSSGTIIQPQAETDSGRFVVSNPSSDSYRRQDFNFSIQSDTEHYVYGSTVTFKVIVWNNTESDASIHLTYSHAHLDPINDYGEGSCNLSIPAKGTASFNVVFPGVIYQGWLLVAGNDASGKFLGSASKGIWIIYPSVTLTPATSKSYYVKGERVEINTIIKNSISSSWETDLKTIIIDPENVKVFEDIRTVILSANETVLITTNFGFPLTSKIGTYTIKVEAWFRNRLVSSASKNIELPQSQILVTPNLSFALTVGAENVSLVITNAGRISVSSGTLDLSLKDPDGNMVYSGSQPFGLAVGEAKTIDVPISIPSLKFGNYTLTYSQSDETRTGKPSSVTIPNSFEITSLTFDKISYKIRETANLIADLKNTGKFNMENVSVTVSAPDASYIDTRTISVGVNPNITSLNFTIPIPETITAGQHNVDVTVGLSSGSNFVKSTTLTVPESKLVIGYSGANTSTAGDTINLTVENTGGVDTTYTTGKLSITDKQGVEVYHGSATGPILSGEKKTLIDIQIPPQTMSGLPHLNVQMSDGRTGNTLDYNKPIEIRGLTSTLQTRTDKNMYLNPKSITGISNILNGELAIEGGSLKLTVTKGSVPTTGQFSHFLPKNGWWSFTDPYAVAIGSDGSIYVADTYNHRIQKFDSNRNFINRWGNYGAGEGEFDTPGGIAVGPDGSVYVADSGNNRIQKFNRNGNFIIKWGSQGSGDGQFSFAVAIAAGPDGSVYVGDSGNNCIQKFSSDGTFVAKWISAGSGHPFNGPWGIAVGSDGSVYVADRGNNLIEKFDSSGNPVVQWGGYGTGDGRCDAPEGIAVGPDDSVYVGDSNNNRIQKFDNSGNFISKWGSIGNGNGQFLYPMGIAVGSDGSVYVADSGNYRIQKFSVEGNFLAKWGSFGKGDGEFTYPEGIAVWSDGSLYVADTWNSRIQKFDRDGNFVTKWGDIGNGDGDFDVPVGIGVAPDGFVYVADTNNNRIQKFDRDGNFVTKWGDTGSGDGELYSPLGIAVGPDGSVYVADTGNSRIQKFDSNGTFITKWGTPSVIPAAMNIAQSLTGRELNDSGETGDVEFNYPKSVAVGPDGSIYVLDTGNSSIQKFDSNGNFITGWGNYGAGDGEFNSPEGIAVGADGSVYVSDGRNHRIQKFDSSGNFITKWENEGSGDGEFSYPEGMVVGVDGSVYVVDSRGGQIQKMVTDNVSQTLFNTTLPISQPASTGQDYTADIGILNAIGKLYLEATLKNSLGQTIAQASYSFYIIEGNTVLLFDTDKKIYKPGDAVVITGQIENRASIDAVDLNLSVHSKLNTQNSELVFTETFDIPAGGTHPFTITTTAGAEGMVTLTGKVTQNNCTLVEITDQYEVAKPDVSASVAVPDVVGNEPFSINVEIKNTGKVGATVQFGVQSSELGDSQTITIPAGEAKLIQYPQQISQNMGYTFTFAGDYEETITKTVTYGVGASLQFGAGSSGLGVFPEGSVAVPVTITNTGQLDETPEVSYQLTSQNSQPVTISKTYYLPKGSSTTETLYFNLTEGDYQITANSQLPTASSQTSFMVRKENKVEMTASLGTQTNGLIPVTVNLNNLGYNKISGSVNVSVSPSTGSGQAVWSGEEVLSQLTPQNPQVLTFNIDPSAIQPGDYGLRIELLNNSGQSLALQSPWVSIQGPVFQITQIPGYQAFYPGQEAIFIFKVKNTGNQEGSFDLRLKAYDLIDSTQREWLKPSEEKTITFRFMLPEDLEEKDYFADYELKASAVAGVPKGQVKYRLAGVSLNVNASLDKPYYNEGETAHLTISIQSNNPNPQNLFARVNYAGYEPQQTFTLNGGQVLIFDVPLLRITGEKLFYGIYHESGRSIHLNSIYIYKAGDVLTITTDKQVYNPGETVSVSVIGSSTGNMTISAPGGYTETFAFSDQATKNFILPLTMTAGTYFINVQLTTQTLNQVQGELITVAHPFDVAGIQVKVLECQNDKGKYASSDTITTSFTISSNTTMPAILKAWIVDPKGQYNSVGEQSINLSSSENLLITYHSSLITAAAGIHRLVYGIYTSGDLLLASGSEAFDVGDAVLLGITTDKRDYPTNTEPVIVTGSLSGSVDANFDLGLDGDVVKSESISVNGFMTYTTQLQNITPGPHTLKATLTAGGLMSTKEINFTYALSFMPKPQISPSPAYLDFGSVNLGSTSTQTITLSSTGNADLVIGRIALSGTTQGDFGIQNDNCSSRTISPAGTCTLGILFSPTSLGAKSASLSIFSNAHDMPTLNLPLAGTGTTTLNISINPGGSGRVAGTGIDCPGDCTENFSTSGTSIQLSATPADGYQFVNWTGDINTRDNPVTISTDTNKNITANFIINVYTINATAGSGGTVLPSGAITVNYGGSQTFSIMPNEGYHVVDVKVDGVSVGAVTNYTFSHITSNHTIEANFAINQYTLTGIAGPNGTISPSGALTVNCGGSQTFTITPNAGNRISDVKVDGGSVGTVSSYIFSNVTSDHTIEVSFAINQYTITATADANGTISPSGSVAVDYGGSQTFNITPNEGYYVADVLVDGKSVGPVITYTFTNTTANHTIEASFASEICILDLPRTGQVTKYAQGDDGCIRAGILWPSPRFTDSADTTVADHLTGLVWAANAGTPTIGSCVGGAKTWQGALDYVTCLNTKHYLGHNDWRLPNLNELESLIHAGQSDSSAWLRFQGFTNVKMNVYWSSTTLVYSSNEAWVVCFHQGEVTYDSKNSKAYVWPVGGMTSGPALLWRTGQTVNYAIGDDGDLMEGAALPVPRFTTNADTTLTDRLTGLVWLPSAGTPTIGSCVGGAKPWQGALDYIACFNTNNHLGHNDWRLPNRKELRSLAHYGEENTATWLNAQGFSNAEPAEYWSSTTSAACPDTAWSIDLVSGEMAGSRKNASGFVLPVRSGAIIPNTAPHLAPTGSGIYEFSTPVILGGKVSDFDGDLLTYEWLEGGRVLFRGQIGTISGGSPVNLPEQIFYLSLGTHVITLWVSDGVNLPVTSDVSVLIIDTTPPVLAPVSDRTILWPPNHQMVNVTIWAHVTDNTHCPVRLEAVVTSNEPQVGLGDGDIGPDWTEPTIDQVKGIIRLQLRSERSGGGKGRIYTITITGTDTSGNKSQAKVEITVPHDKGKK